MSSVAGGAPSTPFSLDKSSVDKVLGKSKEVMVYGFGHAHYTKVSDELKKGLVSIQKVFDWSIGNPHVDKTLVTTALGEQMEQVNFAESPESRIQTARLCKAGITNLVLENFKRFKKGKEFVSLVFCVGSNTADPAFATTAESIATRDPTKNAVITHKELRRLYKLSKEFENSKDPDLKLLSEVAKKSIKMVVVNKNSSGEFELTEVSPMWEDPKWDSEWQKRLALRPSTSPSSMDLKWRREIINRTKIFNASEKFKVPFTEANLSALEQHFWEKLYEINDVTITDCKDMKRILLSDDKHRKDFDNKVKAGKVPSGLSYKEFIEDPIFEIIYEGARKAFY